MLRIPFDEVKEALRKILLARGCPDDKAETVAREITRNSLEGAYTHGSTVSRGSSETLTRALSGSM